MVVIPYAPLLVAYAKAVTVASVVGMDRTHARSNGSREYLGGFY